MLRRYDQVMAEREDQLKLYNKMLAGDYSHMIIKHQQEQLEQMQESNRDIVQQLIPQLIANQEEISDDFDTVSKSRKRQRHSIEGTKQANNFNCSIKSNQNEINNYEVQSQEPVGKSLKTELCFVEPPAKISISPRNNSALELDLPESESFEESESRMNEESRENYKIIQNYYEMRHNRKETSIRKKHIRRCAKELKKDFPCLYNCGKEYATDAARNMHMRTKHNEVTKTERDRKARDIIRNCGLKNNSEIVQKLSMLTKQQQQQLEVELLNQSKKGSQDKENHWVQSSEN